MCHIKREKSNHKNGFTMRNVQKILGIGSLIALCIFGSLMWIKVFRSSHRPAANTNLEIHAPLYKDVSSIRVDGREDWIRPIFEYGKPNVPVQPFTLTFDTEQNHVKCLIDFNETGRGNDYIWIYGGEGGVDVADGLRLESCTRTPRR